MGANTPHGQALPPSPLPKSKTHRRDESGGVFELNALQKVRQAGTKAFAEDTKLELGTHLRLTRAEEHFLPNRAD